MTGSGSGTGAKTSSLDGKQPALTHIPKLPLIGSMIPSYSGIHPLDDDKTFKAWPANREKFGDFYSIGIPGLGQGLYNELYVLQDPNAFAKVMRLEGKHPSSVVELQWSVKSIFDEYDIGRVTEMFGRGEGWKRIRSFLQTDLLSPQSASKYLPGIISTVETISKSADQQQDFAKYLNNAAFDMFSVVMLGKSSGITDPNVKTEQEDVDFAESVAGALQLNNRVNRSVSTYILFNMFGYKDSLFKESQAMWNQALSIAEKKIDEFAEKRATGELTEVEQACYLNQALDRQAGQDDLSVLEAKRVCMSLLAASVDTTAGYASWPILHIAQNKDVQDRIREELQQTLVDGKLTPDSISVSSSPYLLATFRESHRITPTVGLGAVRFIPKDFEVHGVELPAGTAVAFDNFSKGTDPKYVEDPETFNPDRWLPEAVQARKGTPAEEIDHVLFSGPFSQGARRCPGSRVAKNEAMTLAAQLVLDWEITTDVTDYKDVEYHLDTLTVPKFPEIKFAPAQ